jgi:hypothetical protein
MASLPNNTFASPGNPFYAAIGSGGGGGGGGGSTLQSPASIIPASTGSVQLTLPATGAAGSSILLSGTTQNTVNFLQTGAGGEGYITGIADPDGSYVIQSGGAANPAIQYFGDTDRHLTLGDSGTGNVFIKNALQVQDIITSATNGINIEVTGDTTAAIYQSSGASILSLGASNTHKDIIELADNAGVVPGAYIFGQSTGGGKTNPIVISGGAQGAAPNTIYSGVASNGTLTLGSSAARTDQITLTDTTVTIGKYIDLATDLIIPPVFPCMIARQAKASPINGGTTALPMAGLPDGFYLGLVQPTTAGSTDVPSVTCQFSFNFYVQNQLCVAGGVAQNTAGNVFTQPAVGQATISFQNNSGNNILADVLICQMTGATTGWGR